MPGGIPPDFSPLEYARIHRDLAGLTEKQLTDHYTEYGSMEGRPYRVLPQFCPAQYEHYNADLAGMSDSELTTHFERHGRREGRRWLDGLFDASYCRSDYRSYRRDFRSRKSLRASCLIDSALEELKGTRGPVIALVDHDSAIEGGASAFLLALAARIVEARITPLLLVPGGVEEKRRSAPAGTCVLSYHLDSHVLYWILKRSDPRSILLNSDQLEYRDIVAFRDDFGRCSVILHSHETIEDYRLWSLYGITPDYVVEERTADDYERVAGRRPLVQPPIMRPSILRPSGSNDEGVAPVPREILSGRPLSRRSYSTVIVMAGQIIPRKNPELFNALSAACPTSVAFLWIGSTRERALEVFTEGRIYHVPHTTRWTDCALEYSDVLLLTSHHDPCPYVVIEAMRAGLPTIAFEASIRARHPPLLGMHSLIPGEPSADSVVDLFRAWTAPPAEAKAEASAYIRERYERFTEAYEQSLDVPSAYNYKAPDDGRV